MALDNDIPRIPDFYAGRSIFVTGFSGFMGKVLVEKLIWSCPGVKAIYVLLRSKRGVDIEQRLENIINSDLYCRINEFRRKDFEKLKAVEGDVTLRNLGLSPEDRATLAREVSIVFHCAASVRFDDPLPLTVDINVYGTNAVVELALEMRQLVAFVHVSTAYSNCDKFDIAEKVYPPYADWRKTLQIREKIDEGVLNILGQKYMGHLPNTYVFSKSLGEHIVNDHADRLPAVIFRPSIVISTIDEPLPGWVDNLNGPGGLVLGYGSGVVRTCLLESSIQPDFMPVDLAIRGMLVCAYVRFYKRDKEIHFYNWCTRDRSITYADLISMGKRLIDDAPMKYVIWRPSTHTTANSILFYINFILFQMIPAIFIDIFLRIIGKEPLLLKIQRKVYTAMRALSYFTLNYFHFDNTNAYAILDWIKEQDIPEFNYYRKPEDVDNYQFFFNTAKYFQWRFLKMKPQDTEAAETMRKVLACADMIVKKGFWCLVAWQVYSSNLIPRLINCTVEFLLDFQ